LWPSVEAGLSTCATLLLHDIANCTALIFVGVASAGKTTVAEMFADEAVTITTPLCYVSDHFTPASFVSHAAKVKKEDLEKQDLLPRIKHKVLITPELAPLFRAGKKDELVQRFSILTRVLDGHGLQTDSGTHGSRGYRGDYLFAWLGGTTPFEEQIWHVMAQLGSRLFFLLVETESSTKEEELMAALGSQTTYGSSLAACSKVVGKYLLHLHSKYGGIRGVTWDPTTNPEHIRQWIARFARLLAKTRGSRAKGEEETFSAEESPYRANAVLYNLGRGHALINQREQLTKDDLPLLARVTVCSMSTERRRIVRALIQSPDGRLLTAKVQEALQVKTEETAKHVMEDLERLGLVCYERADTGGSHAIRFHTDWEWCGSQEFRQMLGGTGSC